MQQAASPAMRGGHERPRGLDALAAERAGRLLFLVACTALGAAELLVLKPLPQLHVLSPSEEPLLLALGGSLALLAPLSFVQGWTIVARSGLAASWLVALQFALRAAFSHPVDLLEWVPASKDALFAVAAVAVGARPTRTQDPALAAILRQSFGLVMIFYASVHFLDRSVIAELIPSWIPGHEIWPWLTGTVLGLCGLAIVAGRLARSAAFIIAAMFGSWILLLHVERAARDPTSLSEWAFALSAVALLGIALVVGAQAPELSRQVVDGERQTHG